MKRAPEVDPPRGVLSEQFQAHMSGRKLVAAVFTTYCFDPGFFEEEVLPVFLDLPLSHVPAIKRVQLEDALRDLPGSVAVYFDRSGLGADASPPRLDVRRVPVALPSTLFHPKNVFALVEAVEPDEEGYHARTLLVSCSSANLTRSGWWENVEAAHVEELGEGGSSRLRDGLLDFLQGLRRRTKAHAPHDALDEVLAHVRGTEMRSHRSAGGVVHPHFHSGTESFVAFLEDVAGRGLEGLCLEVISPYFDEGGTSEPLRALLERFEPRETRVALPLGSDGVAGVSEAMHAWLKSQPRVVWSQLPRVVVQRAKADGARDRFVHAKVYRFFEPTKGGRELLYVGSANLTTAGHRALGKGGNWENGFVLDVTRSDARPGFWTVPVEREPIAFDTRLDEAEGVASITETHLSIRFDWERRTAETYWDHPRPSPRLEVEDRGVPIFVCEGLASREWQPLEPEAAARLSEVLRSTSLLTVRGDSDEPGVLLVQELGMAHRPSLLFELTPAEILRYWSLLTPEQRAAFVETHARLDPTGNPLAVRLPPLPHDSTLFDRFAGIFHAFESLERTVREALDAGRLRDAEYRLFGKKYDSLGTLLERVLEESTEPSDDARSSSSVVGEDDAVEPYVLLLCARQVVTEVQRAYPWFFEQHELAAKELWTRLERGATKRAQLEAHDAEMPAFLAWFEKWFLRRANPVEGLS
ncbi:MAG: hypothetical protein H6721_07505 [Sandaracinus sp.]|nr:hypothetical protein [Sandaracinus sp.]